jgi:DNA invertase Pin-like site-specific DNA recombinase
MERPALRRLLADIQTKKVDCVVVYKVDRLSRSVYDFAKIMEILEKHGATFVSVTQQFNTATSRAACRTGLFPQNYPICRIFAAPLLAVT